MSNNPSKWASVLGRPIAYFPRLAKHIGNANAAILFAQLVYWEGKIDREIGVYLSLADWAEQTGLSVKEVCTARKILRDAGLVVETEKRIEHKIFYKICEEKYNELLEKMELSRNAESEFPETTKVVSPKRRNGSSCEYETEVRLTVDYNSRLQQEITDSTCASGGGKTDGLRPTEQTGKIVELYKSIDCDKADVRAITEKRKKACEKVYKFAKQYLQSKNRQAEPESVFSWIAKVFREVEKSRFLCGQVKPANGRKQFLLTFDWLVNVDNITKLIEGQYSDE